MVPRSTKVKRRRRAPAPAVPASPADPRVEAILAATFHAFCEHGPAGATTTEIARRAKVSKREIYALFGDKSALFQALVRQRAEAMRGSLALATPADPGSLLDALEAFGRGFLTYLIDPTTIAVYRLAVGEAGRSPELGKALDGLGRATVWEALRGWVAEARERGLLFAPDPDRAAGSFMALLMADLPVRLMLGAVPTPGPEEVARRAAAARAGFARLWMG